MASKRNDRNVKIIFPSTITSFAITFGFISMLMSMENHILYASYLVLLAMIMDGLDGKVARFTNTATEFGIQYDSLSDLIAFGAAPCIIYSKFFLYQRVEDSIFYLAPIMYLLCGAIRLARFNVTASVHGKRFFTGLPIPAAAFAVVSLPILHDWASQQAYLVEMGLDVYFTKDALFRASIGLMVLLSLSMISTMRFDTPVTFWLGKFKFKPLNYVVLGAFLSLWPLIDFAVFAVAITIYYLLSMYGRAVYVRMAKLHKPDEITPSETVA
jgi:CDP-diacylglycerol--serine O-phosphatidyltransferase